MRQNNHDHQGLRVTHITTRRPSQTTLTSHTVTTGRERLPPPPRLTSKTLYTLLSDSGEDERIAALVALVAGAGSDPAAFDATTRIAADRNVYYQIRIAAIETLAMLWPDHPKVADLLTEILSTDPHEEVRGSALRILGILLPEQEDFANLLFRCVEVDPSEWVRSMALRAVTIGLPQSSRSREAIIRSLTSDPHEEVRATAARLLGIAQESGPGVELLRNRISDEIHPTAREAAVSQLVLNGDEVAFEVISTLASFLPDNDERAAWVGIAAALSDKYPEAHSWIRSRMADPSPEVRRTVVEALSVPRSDDPDLLDILRHASEADADSDVREAAAEALAVFSGHATEPG